MTTTTNAFVSPQGIQSAQAITTNAKTEVVTNANAVLLLAGNAVTNGGLVTSITGKPRQSAGAANNYLFRSPDGGATLYFIAESALPTFSISSTVVGPTVNFGYTPSNPLYVKPNESLYVATGVAIANGIVWDAQFQPL